MFVYTLDSGNTKADIYRKTFPMVSADFTSTMKSGKDKYNSQSRN